MTFENSDPVIKIQKRPDGGIRVWSDDVPGLILSGDAEKTLAAIYPCLDALMGRNPTTQDKAPEWAMKEATSLDHEIATGILKPGFSASAAIALALSRVHDQAYERGQESMRERAAIEASGNSHAFDFQRALAECRDSEYGHMSARVEVAKAIRSLPIEQEAGK